MATESRELIIDASIARTVGAGVDPQASRCRVFLEDVFRICHRLLATDALAVEWRDHASPFALRWLSAMRERDKIAEMNVEPNVALRSALATVARNDGERQHMLDDAHLVEGALALISPVVSLDDRARNCFREAAQHVQALRTVVWVNPAAPSETPLEWLGSGAPDEAHRQLGHGLGE